MRTGKLSTLSLRSCCSQPLPSAAGRAWLRTGQVLDHLPLPLRQGHSFLASRFGQVSQPSLDLLRAASMMHSRALARAPIPGLARAESANGAGLASSNAASTADDESGYRLPPPELRDIVDAPPVPALSFSPNKDEIMFLGRRSLPPLSEISKPELKLAGLRIDPESNARSRMSFYSGIKIQKLLDDGSLGPERVVVGYPPDGKINHVTWSPDGLHFAFTIRGTSQGDVYEPRLGLWVADVKTGQARELVGPQTHALNTIFESYSWVDDTTLVACTIPQGRGPAPTRPLTPSAPKLQSNEQGNVAQNRTYQDLLKDKFDEDLFDYYVTSQLLLVSLDGSVKPIGAPAAYVDVGASNDGKYLLISTIHRPYSFIVPCGRFPKKVDLWKANGEFVREICDLPLADDIPITFDSVRKGPRSFRWRADKPSTFTWVETQDGGDSKVEASPRDILYMVDAEGGTPVILQKLDWRYGGIMWGDESLALVYESWHKTRKTRTWVIAPGNLEKEPRLLVERSSEDVYSDPGSPMQRRTVFGSYVIAQFKDAGGRNWLLLDGQGASPEGNIPFLDLFDIETGEKKRIWNSDKEKYYENVAGLLSDTVNEDLYVDKLKVLLSRESQSEPPQYYLKQWPEQSLKQITDFPHPYPQLKDIKKQVIRYKRKDGVELQANLYLPPGYDPAKDGPLPTLLWAYPREFKSKDNAGQMRGSPNAFAGIGSTSPLLWLARRFVILDGPTMPIIGEGDKEANDNYVEQLVLSAEAAVDEVVRRGVSHPKRIAVGGHSYGAFMTANLLAHAPHLFSCGIARSGAYNRTLTPFGFQAEERNLWEATKTYIEMSPFMLADKIKKPILLIHGDEDNNSGTLTMQSERFFSALKGHGAVCRLVLLPLESHSYSARESVMHCLWEMDRWLEKYCEHAVIDDSKSSSGTLSTVTAASAAGTTPSDLVAVAGESEKESESDLRKSEKGMFLSLL